MRNPTRTTYQNRKQNTQEYLSTYRNRKRNTREYLSTYRNRKRNTREYLCMFRSRIQNTREYLSTSTDLTKRQWWSHRPRGVTAATRVVPRSRTQNTRGSPCTWEGRLRNRPWWSVRRPPSVTAAARVAQDITSQVMSFIVTILMPQLYIHNKTYTFVFAYGIAKKKTLSMHV